MKTSHLPASASRSTLGAAQLPQQIMASMALDAASSTSGFSSMRVMSCPSRHSLWATVKPTFPVPAITIFIQNHSRCKRHVKICLL